MLNKYKVFISVSAMWNILSFLIMLIIALIKTISICKTKIADTEALSFVQTHKLLKDIHAYNFRNVGVFTYDQIKG